MKELFSTYEVIKTGELFYLLSIGALGIGIITHRQREWLRNVWNNKCQGKNIGMKHKCGNDIQFHHITPQGWSYEFLGATEEEVDNPYNLIPLCSDAHVGTRGTRDCIHPDQIEALKNYRDGDKEAFRKLQENRISMAREGNIYWNTKWDYNMIRLVRLKIDEYFRNGGEPYPEHIRKNGKR